MMNILRLIVFAMLAALFSCDEMKYLYDCMDCQSIEPKEGTVEIRIKSDVTFTKTINIYEGNLEDNILVGTYTTSNSVFSTNLQVNKKYTVTATYTLSGKLYIAVDSMLPRVKDMQDKCGEECYILYDNICRLKLLRY